MNSQSHDPRWRRLPEERPQQILQAALEVFDEHGLAGARLEDIAKRAGVSKGTIYLYFPNKEELFREMVRSSMIAVIEDGEQPPEGSSATEQLKRYMESYWQVVRSPSFGTIFRLVIGEIHQFPDLTQFYTNEVILRARSLVARIIQHGVTTGEFRHVDPAIASRMFSALFSTTAMWCDKRQCFPHMDNASDGQVFDQLVDFYLHAIRA